MDVKMMIIYAVFYVLGIALTYNLVSALGLFGKNKSKQLFFSLTSYLGSILVHIYFLVKLIRTKKDLKSKKEKLSKHLEEQISLLNRIQTLRAEIQATITENLDERTKNIGDRVKIWDGSGNMDKESGESRNGIDPLFENAGIVIETGLELIMEPKNPWEQTKILDLLIAFPSGEEVYTSSRFVKIID